MCNDVFNSSFLLSSISVLLDELFTIFYDHRLPLESLINKRAFDAV